MARNASPVQLAVGSTCIVRRIRPGVVVKAPAVKWWKEANTQSERLINSIKHNFEVERQLLEILGDHPQLVKYLGVAEEHGLLFAEASHGNLQDYLDSNGLALALDLRLKWCAQAAAAIQFVHAKGVVHSDLRPANYLVDSDSAASLNLLLCDFGGAFHAERDIDGGHLPDSGFFDPTQAWESTPATDIFALGSVMYAIMTGHWPYKAPGPFKSVEESLAYGQLVDDKFEHGEFPAFDHLVGGRIIKGCWTGRLATLDAVVNEQMNWHAEFKS